MHDFREKGNLFGIFLGKKVIIITSKHGTAIFIFFPFKKNWAKKRV